MPLPADHFHSFCTSKSFGSLIRVSLLILILYFLALAGLVTLWVTSTTSTLAMDINFQEQSINILSTSIVALLSTHLDLSTNNDLSPWSKLIITLSLSSHISSNIFGYFPYSGHDPDPGGPIRVYILVRTSHKNVLWFLNTLYRVWFWPLSVSIKESTFVMETSPITFLAKFPFSKKHCAWRCMVRKEIGRAEASIFTHAFWGTIWSSRSILQGPVEFLRRTVLKIISLHTQKSKQIDQSHKLDYGQTPQQSYKQQYKIVIIIILYLYQ